jgi:hypothetical protein
MIKELDERTFDSASSAVKTLDDDVHKRAGEAGKTTRATRDPGLQSAASAPLAKTGVVPLAWNTGATKDSNRTFAESVVAFLTRLRGHNPGWRVLNYAAHDYVEYSADIFLSGGPIKTPGFYATAEAVKFFDDLNLAATDDNPFGIMGWRAIYNDEDVVTVVNAKYGASRVITTPNNDHGPGPKLHIHLDLRPENMDLEQRAGWSKDNGRIVPDKKP